MDRAYLGFGGSNEPEGGASNKEKQRRVDALKVACQTKITAELLPSLRGALEAKLNRRDKWVLRSDETDPDQQTLLFEYPTSSPAAVGSYVRRVVKIEMGARADHWPCETKPVTPYVAEAFPQAFKNPGCRVKVLAVERTFWEKATILHAEFHRPKDKAMPKRFSRHYADLYELVCRGMDAPALSQLDLLARVVQHKSLFFKSSWARHDEAVRGTLRLMPPEHRLTALQDDYARMREMFFHEPPAFGAIMAKLKKWEEDFNRP